MDIVLWASGPVKSALGAAIAAVAGARLRVAQTHDEVPALVAGADALVFPGVAYDAAIAAAVRSAPRLAWMQLASAGFDRIEAHGVPVRVVVTNAGDSWSSAVAEHALALLLALARHLPEAARAQARGEWRRKIMAGTVSLEGATLAVVGFGSIGREVARRARAFGMRVLAVRRSAQPSAEADATFGPERLYEVFAQADAVVVALPQSAETERLFDARAFSACKRGAYLVNVARGGIVDQEALVAALTEGRLGGAGLDVTSPEPLPEGHALWTAPNCIVTPHVAGSGPAAYARLAALVGDNVRRFVAGEPLRNPIEVRNRA